MNSTTFQIEEKNQLTLWENSLPEFQEEPVNKRFRSELDLASFDRS